MKKLRLYLDTSVISFLYAEDSPDFRRVTEEFFARHAAKYELFTSPVTVLEISRDSAPDHRRRLFDALHTYPITMLAGEPAAEIERLAELYLRRGVIPPSKREDALHVAYATVYEVDILLSWNFRHLANIRREGLIATVNGEEGYRYPLRLLSPLGVEDESQS